jgi:biopolymer transport protein TolR
MIMGEINVTPFVDVMLVLLIIFMVTVPLLEMGIEVDLPEEEGKAVVQEREFVISIRQNKWIYLNDRRVTLNDLKKQMEEVMTINKNQDVFLRADKAVPYGTVMEVVALAKKVGIERFGLVTEPPKK